MRKFKNIIVVLLICVVAYQAYITVNDLSKKIFALSGSYISDSLMPHARALCVQPSGVTDTVSGSDRDDELPQCPKRPPGLVGQSHAQRMPREAEYLEKQFSYLKDGGHYSPPNCTAVQRLAIIIPYRNRWSHLHILLNNLVPFLVRQQASFTIFVIEQAFNDTFNRAMLLNIGVVEALKRDNYTCLVFHDVDLIPLNDRHLYRCGPQPMHMAVAISKFSYRLPYRTYFGGASAMTPEQVKAVNGNSNLFFGWGGEDDDLRIRVKAKDMTVKRTSVEIARYWMIGHERDEGNSKNVNSLKLLRTSVERMSVDGLNSLVYKVNSVELKTLYTWINVGINQTEVMKVRVS